MLNSYICESFSYKRMLVRHEISSSSGNCRVLDFTSVLHVSESNTWHQLDQENEVIARRYDMIPREPAASDHDYADVLNMPVLSTYKEAVVEYIAGYVVKSTEKAIASANSLSVLQMNDVWIHPFFL